MDPKHGFRGNASNGAKVNNEIDEKTGIPIISLYGKKESPSAQDLKDIDILVFDIQDVGVRFYTYINTLQHVMEACAENHKNFTDIGQTQSKWFYVGWAYFASQTGVGHWFTAYSHRTRTYHGRICANVEWRKLVEK